jgi:hypothetical protein
MSAADAARFGVGRIQLIRDPLNAAMEAEEFKARRVPDAIRKQMD